MTIENDRYHHGNLKLALLDAAIAQIKEVGIEKLSLRGIARTVGVSQTAPYRHFKETNCSLTSPHKPLPNCMNPAML